MAISPTELKFRLNGYLAFTLTPFNGDGSVAPDVLRDEVELLLASGCSAIFAAGGTGEFFSLAPAEYRTVVETCVQQVRGRVPVVAGAGCGTTLAIEYARSATEAGADGLLVLPPYLIDAPQRGLAAHYRAIAGASHLGMIVYQRGTTVFEPTTLEVIAEMDNVIGFKDGVGDVDRLQRITKTLGDRFVYMNGMPTAEVYASALRACGVTTYSSAILTFMPEVAISFAAAFALDDRQTMEDLLHRAILPFTELRRRCAGYAVSLVKAGARLRGLPMGSVRPPLADPTTEDEADLRKLLADLDLDRPLLDPSAL
jgi:5-dehydro-4-deoxyglucarate dehydratase